MKKLVFIHGPNGVGKSTTCEVLHSKLSRSAWLESEWTRRINPFFFNSEIEKMTEENMTFLLRNYMSLSSIDIVIFNWGFHGPRKEIFKRVLLNLSDIDFEYVPIVITCSEEENVRRMRLQDRSYERIERAKLIREIYDRMSCFTIDSTYLSVNEVVEKILGYLCIDER